MEYIQVTREFMHGWQVKYPSWFWPSWTIPNYLPKIRDGDRIRITTKKGVFLIEWGDYIIKLDNGDLMYCAQDKFKHWGL